ncbi:MAG: cupredoxin domain-containing protein [Chloroflexota bacterium]
MIRSTVRSPGTGLIVLVLVASVLAAGCDAGPGPSTAIPSSAATDGVPTEVLPTPVVTPVPTDPGAQGEIVLTAENVAFRESDVAGAAGVPFTLQLVNRDAGIPHGVEIRDQAGRSVFRSEIVTGPAQPVFDVPALEAGSYTFVCPVHPNMVATFVVGG